jgi:hypothetical protein
VEPDEANAYLNIVVSHHGPQPVGERSAIDNWASVGSEFFLLHNLHLWIFGHYHKHDTWTIDNGDFRQRPVTCVQVPTMRVEEGDRGFCLLTLHRAAGAVTSATLQHFPFGRKQPDPIPLPIGR